MVIEFKSISSPRPSVTLIFCSRKPMIETASTAVVKEDIRTPEPPEGLLEMKEMKEMLEKYFANQVRNVT